MLRSHLVKPVFNLFDSVVRVLRLLCRDPWLLLKDLRKLVSQPLDSLIGLGNEFKPCLVLGLTVLEDVPLLFKCLVAGDELNLWGCVAIFIKPGQLVGASLDPVLTF